MISEPRTWTIALPAGSALLNANQRLHWAEKGKRTRQIRGDAFWLAKVADIPPLDRVRVVVEYRPALKSRRRDAANWAPSAKACLDGMTDAGIWPDDNSAHVLSETYVIGDPVPLGQLLIHITEVAEEGVA